MISNATVPATPTGTGLPATLIERAVEFLPGPYALWALVIAAVFGVPGFIVARFLDTGSVDAAFSLFDWNLPSVGTYFLATFGITLYALLGIRFMRSRTRAAETGIAPLLPEGPAAFRRAFAPVTNPLPPLCLTPILLIVSFAAFPDQMQDITGPSYLILRVLSFPVAYFVYACFIWVYLSSIRGLRLLGKGPLRLQSYLEDSHFGLKPFGSLSLFLALVYFLGLVLVGFSFIALPPLFVALLAALALPGIILFFLPLRALHRRMLEEGAKASSALADAYSRATPTLSGEGAPGSEAAIANVKTLLALQILEHRVEDIRRWPLDLRTMSWFSAILLSVAAAIATRYVLTYLGA